MNFTNLPELLLLSKGGDGYAMIFRAPTAMFDNPETQSTLNNILESFKFSNNG